MSKKKKVKSIDILKNIPDEELGAYVFNSGRLTTPEKIDENIRKFCRELSPTEKPIFLDVKAEDWSRENYCIKNVEKMIELNGGKIVLGYKIWYVTNLYIEAERHAVWCNTEDELVDVTYNVSGEEKILFLMVNTMDTVISQEYLKPRKPFHPRLIKIINWQIQNEKIKSQYVYYDNSWEGWQQAKSYLEWNQQEKRRKFLVGEK